MQLKSGVKIILPLLIVASFITFFVLQISEQEKTTDSAQQKAESVQTSQPKNPTPENIQILGRTDIAPTPSAQNSKLTTKESVTFDTQTLYNLVNSYRKDNKLNKLYINKLLEDSSQRKIADMINTEYFRHSDTNNNESWYLFQAAGYQYKFAGENLSSGNNTPWQVFEAWQGSAAHNEQLLKPEYQDMGIAVNCEEYKIGRNSSCLVVLHLGTR